jgi:dihydrofolate reductase
MITLIAAMAANRVIGKDNWLPRDYPEDMAHFRSMTAGKPIVMGRKTFESIGRPLPKRRNIVLSRSWFAAEGVEVFGTIDEIIAATKDEPEVMIIWGQTIYEQFLPYADRIQLTIIHKEYQWDTYFPVFEDKFVEVDRDARGELDFVTYNKK